MMPASASRCSTRSRPVRTAGHTTYGVAASMTLSRRFIRSAYPDAIHDLLDSLGFTRELQDAILLRLRADRAGHRHRRSVRVDVDRRGLDAVVERDLSLDLRRGLAVGQGPLGLVRR